MQVDIQISSSLMTLLLRNTTTEWMFLITSFTITAILTKNITIILKLIKPNSEYQPIKHLSMIIKKCIMPLMLIYQNHLNHIFKEFSTWISKLWFITAKMTLSSILRGCLLIWIHLNGRMQRNGDRQKRLCGKTMMTSQTSAGPKTTEIFTSLS